MRLPFAKGLTTEAARFQWRLLAVLALVVLATASAVLLMTRHNIARQEEHRRETEFQMSLALLRSVQLNRHEALVERCRSMATKSRIQAALEDNAEDLLYLSAKDELRDLLAGPSEPAAQGQSSRRLARLLGGELRAVAHAGGGRFRLELPSGEAENVKVSS